ncbi:lytic transglycosylase domain-containing protein [Sphingobium lactosutens]|uniref:Murein transglycosylase n=1 Tax=Sphingobium lactosutens DS20 TaxID=1331060 RepID=T0HPL9_9SPHN|nr:lytic transglycosylase domain-containing protein [Sphingobium lactosutens]EQB14982.1 hypothetical protein RLDS_12490 [Sphingobium lactosutens DS20]
MMWAISKLLWPAMLLAALLPQPASAKSRSAQDERVIAACIHHASLGRPWLEKTLWGLRDQEGGWIGAEVENTNGSHDLGPMQVNSWWITRLAAQVGKPAAQVRHWLKFDACFNAEAARWVFLSALRATGDYWKAVGVYHSPTAWRQRRYTASVVDHLRSRFGANIFVSPQKIDVQE